jgi:hypothetical protein
MLLFWFPGFMQRKIAMDFPRIIAAAFFLALICYFFRDKPNFTNLGIRDNGQRPWLYWCSQQS